MFLYAGNAYHAGSVADIPSFDLRWRRQLTYEPVAKSARSAESLPPPVWMIREIPCEAPALSLSANNPTPENNCVRIVELGAHSSSGVILRMVEMGLPILFVLGGEGGIVNHQQILRVVFLGCFREVERAG